MICKCCNNKNLKVFIFSLFIVFFVAFLGSVFTTNQVNSDWYQSIKPEITPPNYLFPIVWNILFLMITFSLYLSWIESNETQKKKIILAFGINLFLNFLWSFIYFGLMNPALAFFELILLWLSIIFLMKTVYGIKKTSTYLLIPYFLWVTFAGFLNYLSI